MNSGQAPARAPRRRRAAIIFVLGLGLLALAVWSAARSQTGGSLADAWASVRAAPLWLVACAVLLPGANWLLTSAVFWVLTRRYGEVGAGEMARLIGAAWLMNYIPMRPGLFGRVAYHKAINRIAIADSVRVLALSIGASGVATFAVLVCGVLINPGTTPAGEAAVFLAPALGFGVVALIMGRRTPEGWRLGAAVLLRYLDVLVWAGRYAVVFALIGRPLEPAQAAAIAGVSQLVLVIPLAGNGLGIREWAVGWAAAALPAWYSSGPVTAGVTAGLSADLVNRAGEVIAAVTVGTVCMVAVARRVARGAQARTSSTTA